MNDLPPKKEWAQREVFDMLILRGLESVTRALMQGDGFKLENLRPLAQRCRALADAYDRRVKDMSSVVEE